jgi:hypothetical protein
MRYDESRNHPDCRICLGSGRISDRIPAADALADAETLRLCDPYAGGITYLDTQEELGRMLRLELRRKDEARAVKDAVLMAHYAFLAVPGLRG